VIARGKSRKPAFVARAFSDGPLRARPPEEIVYGTGKCALGPLLVASSDDGIVTIMVRSKSAELIADITARFPRAAVIRDEKRTRPLVDKVVKYIAAPFEPFELPLDLRGTEFQQRVWNEVRKIPFGATSTYSEIAEAIGAPKAIRAVASSCSNSWFAFAVPCHRVLHKQAATPGRRKQPGTVQYRWSDYEAELLEMRSNPRRNGLILEG
jgi:AraC family transcriptional regulator, regulatory protein of adaptative response / methylated-DNA-[protein]-cysteine methyltransferase